MRKLPPLNSLRAFEAAARHGSFTAAAKELFVTVTAVSHQIRQLEELIDKKLFERSGRAVVLTEAGAAFYPRLRDGFDQLAEAFAQVSGEKEADVVAVSMTKVFAERWLMPRLDRFHSAFPDVIVNVHASEKVVDLRAESIDLAIRYGPVDLAAKPMILLRDVYLAVAASSISNSERQPVIDDYRKRPLLAYKWKNPAFLCPTWSTWLAETPHELDGDFKISWFSEETLALHAAERGLGPLLTSNILVDEKLRDGTLRRIEGPILPGYAYRLIEGPSFGKKKSAVRFADWLKEEAVTFARDMPHPMNTPSA
jgi:LysR family glycine cleavage system transcriptional activator